MSPGLFKYIKAAQLLSKYATFIDREDDQDKETGLQHTRRDEEDVLYEETAKRRRKLQLNVENIEFTRRGPEHIDDRYLANTGITRCGWERIDDQEIQQESYTELRLVFE